MSYPVEIVVQGKCIISCIIIQDVQVVHILDEGHIGIVQLWMRNFPKK